MRNLLVILFVLVVGNSFAATVNYIIRDSIEIVGSSVTYTFCDDVDTSKSILIFSVSVDDTDPSDVLIAGYFSATDRITFLREGTGGDAMIYFQVVEFSSGVSVQHGVSTVNSATYNETIPATTYQKSFVLSSMMNVGGTFGSDDGYAAYLTSATNLQIRCDGSGFDVYWQVVDYDSCTVQLSSSNMSGTSSTGTIATSVTTTKTMLINGHRNSGNVNADDLPRTVLTNGTTITHTRNGSASTLNHVTQVVEFTDLTTVIHGSTSFGSGDGNRVATVAAGGLDSSVVVCQGNLGRQGSTAYNSNDNMSYGWFRYQLSSTTELNIVRDNTGSTAEATWQVIRFEYDQTDPPSTVDADPSGPYDDMLVRSIQRGTATVTGTTTDVTVNSVDMSKSFLTFSTTCDDADVRDFMLSCALTSSTNIRFQRVGNGTTADVAYELIEFYGDITVQHGSHTIASTTDNITISSVDLDKTFVVATIRRTGTDYGSDDGFIADLTGPTNLQIRAGGTGAVVEYQVVQYDDSHVRTLKTTLAAGETNVTRDFTAGCSTTNGVNTSKTFLISQHTQSGSTSADDLPKVTLEDSTTVRIQRNTGNHDLEYIIYVVETFDSTNVQQVEVNFGSGETSRSETITSVDTSKSIVFGTGAFMREGMTAYTTNDNTGYNWATFQMASPTSVTATRANSGATATVPFQVIEFLRGEEPLPIEFGSFDVIPIRNDRRIFWTTYSEHNSKHYIVQISYDGKKFETIGTVDAAGFSNELIEYYFEYRIQRPFGDEYYRIVEVDNDGQKFYSNIISIEGNDLDARFSFPNPAKDILHVYNPANEAGWYLIRSLDGKIAAEGALTPSENNLDVSNIAKGVYLIEISLPKENAIQERLVIE